MALVVLVKKINFLTSGKIQTAFINAAFRENNALAAAAAAAEKLPLPSPPWPEVKQRDGRRHDQSLLMLLLPLLQCDKQQQ